jgi:hypothetical protein
VRDDAGTGPKSSGEDRTQLHVRGGRADTA